MISHPKWICGGTSTNNTSSALHALKSKSWNTCKKKGWNLNSKIWWPKVKRLGITSWPLGEETGEVLPIQEVTEKFFVDLNEFKENLLPLIIYLGNEAIEREHCDEIERITGVTLKQPESPVKPGALPGEMQIYLIHIQKINVEQNRNELEEISTKAFKQHRIKKDMKKIEVQIKDRELSIVPYGA